MTAKADLIELGPGVSVRLNGLLADKLLIVGNSGSGKSFLMRRLAEQLGRQIPIFVFDREGEFATLREKLPMVLVGDGGEVEARVETAGKLARRLVELGVSAILNLHGMTKRDQRNFVREFLQSLIDLPQSMWGGRVVFIDEIHESCPQSGTEADARETVNQFMALGRKRGFGVVAATQRLSKLHKDSAAEFNNVCIGRCTLDVDLKRAGERIYFGKDRWAVLRGLKPGQFYAVGPSFVYEGDDDVVLFRSGDIETHHPTPGERSQIVAPPPTKAILKFAAELKGLQSEVAAEASAIDQLRAENERLRKDLASKSRSNGVSTPSVAAPDPRALERARQEGLLQGQRLGWDRCAPILDALVVGVSTALSQITAALEDARKEAKREGRQPARLANGKPSWTSSPNERNSHDSEIADDAGNRRGREASQPLHSRVNGSPSRVAKTKLRGVEQVGDGAEGRVLAALLMHTGPVSRRKVALMAGVAAKTSTLRNALSKLRQQGWLIGVGGDVEASAAARERFRDVDPLPTGKALIRYWRGVVGDGAPGRLLDAVVAVKGPISDAEARESAGLNDGTSTYRNAKSKLHGLGLIDTQRGQISLAGDLR